MLNLTIDRDSICEGDRRTPRTMDISVKSTMSLNDLFYHLLSKKYFPSIKGRRSIWVLCHNDVELLSFSKGTGSMIPCFIDSLPSLEACIENTPYIYFSYYPTPEERAEHIFKTYVSSPLPILKECCTREYRSYKIPSESEIYWKNN